MVFWGIILFMIFMVFFLEAHPLFRGIKNRFGVDLCLLKKNPNDFGGFTLTSISARLMPSLKISSPTPKPPKTIFYMDLGNIIGKISMNKKIIFMDFYGMFFGGQSSNCLY